MKLISLELTNFRQHLDSNIAFSDGVTGIVGPNGSGKTTILEAIAWVLYGAPALRGNNDTVRSAASAGGARVSARLSFDLSGSVYTVQRTLDSSGKNPTAVVEVDGKPLRSGVKEVSESITRLLGMDYQAFFTSFFTAQKELDFMSQLDGRQRAIMISRMLGYERLTKARDRANADRLGLQKEIEGLKQGMADTDELKQRLAETQVRVNKASSEMEAAQLADKTARETLDRLKPLKEDSDQKARRHDELSRSVEVGSAEIVQSETRLKQLEAEREDLNSKQAKLESLSGKVAEYELAGKEFRKLSELQKHEAERQRLAGQIAALDQEIAKRRKRSEQMPTARDRASRAAIALGEAETQLQKMEERIRVERERIVGLDHSLAAKLAQLGSQRSELESRKQRIQDAGEEGACPTCERPLAGEFPKVLSHFDSHVAEISKEIATAEAQKQALAKDSEAVKTLEQERKKLTAAVETLRAEKVQADALVAEIGALAADVAQGQANLDELRRQMASLPSGFDQNRYRELQQKGDQLRPFREQAVALKAALERAPVVDSEIRTRTALIRTQKAQVEEAQKSLQSLGFSSERHDKLTQDFAAAQTQAAAAAIDLERRKGEAATAQAILDGVKHDLETNKSRAKLIKDKQSERLHLETLAKAFDTLRAQLNEQIRPELEGTASELLATMTDGRYNVLEINDSYEPVIRDDGELKPVISGGEEDVVNLALRLAISQMIADRAGQSFSLLILDEVFGSLDESRRDNVVALLQNLKNRFEQIILITHVEAIHDAVDNCVWVRFDERSKTSRLTERSDGIAPEVAGNLQLGGSE